MRGYLGSLEHRECCCFSAGCFKPSMDTTEDVLKLLFRLTCALRLATCSICPVSELLRRILALGLPVVPVGLSCSPNPPRLKSATLSLLPFNSQPSSSSRMDV